MEWTVAIGIDTHRDEHVAVAVDRLGQRLGVLAFTVDETGFAQVAAFARAFGEPTFAIEGTGSYGASLARSLLSEGFAVFECERPARRRRQDKNDLIDAELAARRLLSDQPLALPRTGAEREQLRLLLIERRSANHARQQALNQLKAAIVTLDPPLRRRLGTLKPAALARDATLQRQSQLAPLRRLAKRIVLLEQELAEADRELTELTRALCPRLLAEPGSAPSAPAKSSSPRPTLAAYAANPPLPRSRVSAPSRPQADRASVTD